MVSNLAYWRWDDAYPIVRSKIDDIQERLQSQVIDVDAAALAAYLGTSPTAAVEIVTEFGVLAGEKLHEEWLEFYGDLFVRFRDFSTIIPKADNAKCGCEVEQPGLSDENKDRIVEETGTHYEIPPESVPTFMSFDEKGGKASIM